MPLRESVVAGLGKAAAGASTHVSRRGVLSPLFQLGAAVVAVAGFVEAERQHADAAVRAQVALLAPGHRVAVLSLLMLRLLLLRALRRHGVLDGAPETLGRPCAMPPYAHLPELPLIPAHHVSCTQRLEWSHSARVVTSYRLPQAPRSGSLQPRVRLTTSIAKAWGVRTCFRRRSARR